MLGRLGSLAGEPGWDLGEAAEVVSSEWWEGSVRGATLPMDSPTPILPLKHNILAA